MRRFHTLTFAGAVLLLVMLAPANSSSQAAAAQSIDWRYRAAPCAFTVPAGYEAACGWLNVPQDRQDPSNPTLARLELHVAHFPSTNPTPPQDPILYLVGGPGVSLLYDIDTIFYHFEPYIHNRDVIVYDQRGTGFSTPALICDTDGSISTEDWRERYATCATVYRTRGYDLEHFNSVESAADAEDLRRALGIDEWNVVGVSYGSRLAQVIARDFPAGVRSVVLDAVVGLGEFQSVQGRFTSQDWILQIIEDCEADTRCNTAYPTLRTDFRRTRRQLIAEPVRIPDTAGAMVVINANRYENTLRSIAGNTAGAWRLPAIIDASARGDFSAIVNFTEPYTFWDVMNRAVNCNDAPPPAVGNGDAVCNALGVDYGPRLDNPRIDFETPTLVINGRYDSITPTPLAVAVADELAHSYFYEFPYLAHGVVRSDEPCAKAVAFAFLAEPLTEPAAAAQCIERTMPQFVTQDAAQIVG